MQTPSSAKLPPPMVHQPGQATLALARSLEPPAGLGWDRVRHRSGRSSCDRRMPTPGTGLIGEDSTTPNPSQLVEHLSMVQSSVAPSRPPHL